MPRLFTDDQVRRTDIDTLKRWLRTKLDGYTVVIKDLRSNNEFYRGVPWSERPNRVSDISDWSLSLDRRAPPRGAPTCNRRRRRFLFGEKDGAHGAESAAKALRREKLS
jgi:hypothetical protein